MTSVPSRLARLARGALPFALVLLAIELLDELTFGAREAAWPLIRADLGLTYAQIGLLLGLPGLAGSLLEPALGVLGDLGWRRGLMLGGGVAFALACLLTGLAPEFYVLLASFAFLSPASGAFVGLAQATLMDTDPERHEPLMARWTLAGSLGVVGGPLLLGGALALGLGWRGTFMAMAAVTLALTALTARYRFPARKAEPGADSSMLGGLRRALRAALRRDVLRWLILLAFSDFMLDILLGFLALYAVDVARATPAQGALAVAVWSGVGLLGDALLIPLLERVRGLAYLRVSALIILFLYPAFLLAPTFELKLVALALLGLFNAGWYAILKGRLYSSLPGQSGTVMAVDSVFGIGASFVPALLGLVAQRFGLAAMMWLLILGPVALLVGLPRRV